MRLPLLRRRWVPVTLVALACATATPAATLTATLLDPPDAPAAVSSCSIDNDSSGVFTPAIAIVDRKPAALTSADVGIDFFDAQNRPLGHVIVAPPFGPTALPFGSIDRVACRIVRAEFADGARFAPYEHAAGGGAALPVAGAILGVGAAAALAGSSHSGSSSGASSGSTAAPTATPTSSTATATPVPVASVVPLSQRRKAVPTPPPFTPRAPLPALLPPTPLPVRR